MVVNATAVGNKITSLGNCFFHRPAGRDFTGDNTERLHEFLPFWFIAMHWIDEASWSSCPTKLAVLTKLPSWAAIKQKCFIWLLDELLEYSV